MASLDSLLFLVLVLYALMAIGMGFILFRVHRRSKREGYKARR
jgi:hypothetical protein